MEDSLLGEEDFSHPESGLGVSASSQIANYPYLTSRVPHTATGSSLEEDAGYGHSDAGYEHVDAAYDYGGRDTAYGRANDVYTPPTLQGVRRAGRRSSTPALASDGRLARSIDAGAGAGVGAGAGGRDTRAEVGAGVRVGASGAETGTVAISIPPSTATHHIRATHTRATHTLPAGAASHALSLSPEAASRLSREADPLLLDYVDHYDADADAHVSPHHIAAQDSLYFQLPDDLCHFDVAALDSDSDDDGLPVDGYGYGFAAGPENAVELDVLSPFGASEGSMDAGEGVGQARTAAAAARGEPLGALGVTGRRRGGVGVSATRGAGAGAGASTLAHTAGLPPMGGRHGVQRQRAVDAVGGRGRVCAPTRLRQPRPLPNVPSYDNGYSPARNHDHDHGHSLGHGHIHRHGLRHSPEEAQGQGVGCSAAMSCVGGDPARVCGAASPRARAVVVRTGVGDPVDDASDVESVLSLQSDASLHSESSLASGASLPSTAVDSDAVLYGGQILVSQLHWSVQADVHYYHCVNGVADPRGMKLHAFSHSPAPHSTSATAAHAAMGTDSSAGAASAAHDAGAGVAYAPAVCVSVPRVKALQALAAVMGDAVEVATEHHCHATHPHCRTTHRYCSNEGRQYTRHAGHTGHAGYHASAGATGVAGDSAHERKWTQTRTNTRTHTRTHGSGAGTGAAVVGGRGHDTTGAGAAHEAPDYDDDDDAADADADDGDQYSVDAGADIEEADEDVRGYMDAAHYSATSPTSTSTSTSSISSPSPYTSAVPGYAPASSPSTLSLGPDAIIIDNTASATNTTPFRNPSFDPYLSPLLIQPATCCLCCVYKPYERTRPPRIPLSRPGGHSLMWCLYRHNTPRLERAYDAWWRQAVVPVNERALTQEAGGSEQEQGRLMHSDGANAGGGGGGVGDGVAGEGVSAHVVRAEEQKQASPVPHKPHTHTHITAATNTTDITTTAVSPASPTAPASPSPSLAGLLLTHNAPAQTLLFADGATSTGINVQVTAAGRWIVCPPPHIVDIYNLPGEDTDEHWYSHGYMAFGANNLYTAYDDTAVPVALRRHELREYTQSKGVRADYAAARERAHRLGSEHTLLRIDPAKEHLNIVTHSRGAWAGLGGQWGVSRSVWLGRALPPPPRGDPGRDSDGAAGGVGAGALVEYTPSSTVPLAPHGQRNHAAIREKASVAHGAAASPSSLPSSPSLSPSVAFPTSPAYDYSGVLLGARAREEAAERAMLEFERYQDAVQRRRLRALLPRALLPDTLLPDAVADLPTGSDATEVAGALGVRHSGSGSGSGYYHHYTPATHPTRTRPQSQSSSSPAARGWLGLAYNEPGMLHGGGCARVSGVRAAWLCVHADAPVGMPRAAVYAGESADHVPCEPATSARAAAGAGEAAEATDATDAAGAVCADGEVGVERVEEAIAPASDQRPPTTSSALSSSSPHGPSPRGSPPRAHSPTLSTTTTTNSPTVYLHGDALPAHACLPAPPAVYAFDPDRWLVPPSHIRSRCACLYAIIPGAGRVRCPHFPSLPFLDYFIGRPRTDYSHWWRQRQLLFWVWNPPMDEEITQFRHRLILLVFVLCFNLTVLTTWANAFGSVSGRIASQLSTIPYVGKTLVLYVSTNLLQAVFVGLARPFMSLTLSKLPVLQRSPLRRTRFLGYLLYYTCILVAVFFLLFVLLGVFVLIMRYRCDVLYTQVLYPFAVLTLLNLFYAYSIVPLPVLYHLQNAYGSMPAPIGGGYLDHLRAEHARLGAHAAAVDGALVPYTEEQLFEYYVRKGEGRQPR